MFEQIKVLAFDADDTLWENEPLFRAAEARWAEILKDYGTVESLSAELYAVESENMEELGYGSKAFTLSLMETAINVSGGTVTGAQMEGILAAGRSILRNPAIPMEGVEETLEAIRACGRWKMIILTKGDLLEQGNKVMRSGLAKYFDMVEIVSNKCDSEYRSLCSRLGITPEEFLMVGNSFKSDIAPVLNLGGCGIHIPYHITWEHEQMEEFDHHNLIKISRFCELKNILL